MEEIMCVGLRHLDFVNSKGERVFGTSVFYTQQDEAVAGVAAGKLWVPGDKWFDLKVQPKVGGKFTVFFNKKGKVHSFADVK